MNEKIKQMLKKDIQRCEDAIQRGGLKSVFEEIYARYKLLDSSISDSIPQYVHGFGNDGYEPELKALKSVLETYLAFESIPINFNKDSSQNSNNIKNDAPIIFLSHKSDDKKYGDALRNFIIGLGVNDSQLIYTDHPLNKIPMDENIFDYLRKNINSTIFMIILWSNKYLESPACLNEMGAAWVVQADYTNIYVPGFLFGNPKYHECAVDTRKMGAVLDGSMNCRTSMLELKDKIVNMFKLEDDEKKTAYLLDEFMKAISESNEDSYHIKVVEKLPENARNDTLYVVKGEEE